MKGKTIIRLISICFLIVNIIGCDAFVRKFTRKKSKDELPQETMVLAPEEYKAPQVSKAELYRQYFLYWKSWQDELTESLLQKKSNKKQVDCAEEALKNLISLKPLLVEGEQKKLDVYITRLQDLRDSVAQDIYGNNSPNLRDESERIKRDILRDLSYNKIKNYLP